jgi:WD40 repeat protein
MKRAIVASLLLLGSVVAGAVAEQPAADAQPNPIPVRCLAFSRDHKSLAAAYGGSDSVIVWDVASRRAKYKGRERAEIRAVAFSPVNETLAIGSGSLAKLVDPKTDRVLRELNGQQRLVRSMAFTPDGNLLAIAGADRTVKLWDLATGAVVETFSGHQGPVLGVAISPDGKWLAAACGQTDAVHIWSLKAPMDKPRILDLPGRQDFPGTPNRGVDVLQVALSPDGRFLAAPDWGQGCVSIIDMATGKSALKFTSMNGWKCAAFSPDGKWLAL